MGLGLKYYMCNDNALPVTKTAEPAGVLVVEDSFDLRFTLAEWLRNQKYTVYEAATADEAKVLLDSPFTIDVVITDVEMPGTINGLGLVEHIRQIDPHMNVIVVSGNDKYLDLKRKGIPFFRKPYDLRQISSHIEQTLKNRM